MCASHHVARRPATAQHVLVIAHATASTVLLSVAVMLGQSLQNIPHRPLGFAAEGRYLVSIDTRLSHYTEDQLFRCSVRSTLDRTIPGVKA